MAVEHILVGDHMIKSQALNVSVRCHLGQATLCCDNTETREVDLFGRNWINLLLHVINQASAQLWRGAMEILQAERTVIFGGDFNTKNRMCRSSRTQLHRV